MISGSKDAYEIKITFSWIKVIKLDLAFQVFLGKDVFDTKGLIILFYY